MHLEYQTHADLGCSELWNILYMSYPKLEGITALASEELQKKKMHFRDSA